ncbi:transposase [Spirosoma pollinicola]
MVKTEFDTWESQGLSIFYLPTYSPHLNPIEILLTTRPFVRAS